MRINTAVYSFFSLSFIPRSLNIRADSLNKEAQSCVLNYSVVNVLAPEPLVQEASMFGPV